MEASIRFISSRASAIVLYIGIIRVTTSSAARFLLVLTSSTLEPTLTFLSSISCSERVSRPPLPGPGSAGLS
jgi:hypothetical protein